MLVFKFGPDVFPLLQPDSASYLQFESFRSALYPVFLQILLSFQLEPQQIAWVQFGIYILTLSILMFTLVRQDFPFWTVGLFSLCTGLNVYFIGFHSTILSESLVFSIQNLLLVSLLLFVRRPALIWAATAGVLTGLIAGLRPALWSQAIALTLVIALWTWGDVRRLAACIAVAVVGLAAMAGAESWLHARAHDSRQSLMPLIMFGKGAMLATGPDFRIEGQSPEIEALAEEVEAAFRPVATWFSEVHNPFVEAVRAADFEVLAQYQLLNDRIDALARQAGMSSEELRARFGRAAIAQNPGIYAELSALHYLGLWSVHALTFFERLDGLGTTAPLPFPEELAVGAFDDSVTPLALIVFPGFLGLGMIVLGLTLLGLVCLPPRLLRWRALRLDAYLLLALALSLTLFVQGNLVSTALANVSTPRYLMASYPYAVLAALLLAAWLLRSLRNSKGRIAAQ